MSEISNLIQELNDLPKGYIAIKVIHNKTYFYLQRKENGKVLSTYIKESDVENLNNQIKRRKEIEKQLDVLLNGGNNLNKVSKTLKSLTGYLMSEDKVVATFNLGVCVDIDESLCPLYILRTKNIEGFLKLRSIDTGRTNSRLLKKALGIKNDEGIALYANGATITDNYWFKSKKSKLKYKDISFDGDIYSDLALKGELVIYPKIPKLTPEITTPGSYEKCWKKIDNEWWLYKQGNENEIFSELFCSKLAELLNINTASYEKKESYIRTKNFASKYNFEPMISIAGEDDSYDNVFNCLFSINPNLAKEYLLLIWFDTLVNNVDRHNENCGVLRNRKTGEIVSLAPNFDNNLALVSRNTVLNFDCSKDGFTSYFVKFIKNNKNAMDCFKKMKLPKLNTKLINECFKQIDSQYRKEEITKYILTRYEYLNKYKKM